MLLLWIVRLHGPVHGHRARFWNCGGFPGTGTGFTTKCTKITKAELDFFFVAFARFVVRARVHGFIGGRKAVGASQEPPSPSFVIISAFPLSFVLPSILTPFWFDPCGMPRFILTDTMV